METRDVIERMVKTARHAQEKVSGWTQEQIDRACVAVAWEMYCDDNIRKMAELAVAETGMGSVKDKITKHKNKILGVIDDVLKVRSVGLIEENEALGIKKFAKPVGVVGALTPVTNPTATPGSNAVSILKGRNAVIFAPHPGAKRSAKLAVDLMRQGLKKAGAPEDLIQVIEEPSIELTGELMRQVDLVVATGGGPMVKAAYSSGKPAYGVGPGNACQIVAEDADVLDAAKKITVSKTFDYATSCSSENSIIVQEGVYDSLMSALKQEGAFLVTGEDRQKLKDAMWKKNKNDKLVINGGIVARSALKIAESAGLKVPENTRMLLVEGEMPLEEDLFAGEKLSPVLAVWKYKEFLDGVDILRRLTDNAGRGHSCGIHTFKQEYIDYLGEHMQTSRVMVRQPQAAANGGAFFNGMPSTVTLGCGTWGNNITNDNITYKHFINVTWVSVPIPLHKPSDEQIFGEYLKSIRNNQG